MYSDDVYRARVRATIADLEEALASLSTVAALDIDLSGQGARVMLTPHAIGACPVELMLRADQHYDIALGSAIYEDCPIERLEFFKPLILAIAEGRVVQRHHISAHTGVQSGFETIVSMPFGSEWRKGQGPGSMADVYARDQHYLPYRR